LFSLIGKNLKDDICVIKSAGWQIILDNATNKVIDNQKCVDPGYCKKFQSFWSKGINAITKETTEYKCLPTAACA